MAYKPFSLRVDGKTITLTSGDESLSRLFMSENTAAQRFGEMRKQIIESLTILLD